MLSHFREMTTATSLTKNTRHGAHLDVSSLHSPRGMSKDKLLHISTPMLIIQQRTEQTMQEMRTIPDFPHYSITPDGKVFSHKNNCFLKPAMHSRDGYQSVVMHKKRMKIHRLVALTYIPNPEDKPIVDHINRHRFDNRRKNLRWATQKENQNNKPVGHGGVRFDNCPAKMSKWLLRWCVSGKNKCKYFKTKEEAEAYRIIVYQLRVCIRKMRGLSY
jgi:hypothetical protein